MTPGNETPINQSRVGYSRVAPPGFVAPISLFSNPPLSPYHVFCLSSAGCVLPACTSDAPATPHHLLCSLQCSSVTSADSGFSKTCFYIKASFASRSWCGGGPRATAEGDEETGTTVRLSSALVPLGRTRVVGRNYFMNNLPYSRLIFKRNIISQ